MRAVWHPLPDDARLAGRPQSAWPTSAREDRQLADTADAAGTAKGADAGVTPAGVPPSRWQAATTAGWTSRLSMPATVAPPSPSVATTGCATGTTAPSTLHATASACVTLTCWSGGMLLHADR